jgi:hypothetical protein
MQPDATALAGKIAEGSAILAVDMPRADAAEWARRGVSRCASDHDDRIVGAVQTLHIKVGVIRSNTGKVLRRQATCPEPRTFLA